MRVIITIAVLCMALVAPLRGADSVKLAVTDLVGLEQLQTEFGAFVKVLEKATGKKIEFFPVSNRVAASQALKRERVDFVLTGPAEYVVMTKQTQAYPIVGFSRPDYFSGVIVLAESPYQTVADLKGQKVAVGDVGSTSNHLGPMQVLADLGLNPTKDLEIINTKRKIAFEALKKGEIAAFGVNYGKFMGMRAKEHESGGLPPGAFRVIGRGRDLPNDVLMAGKHVDASTVKTIRDAFASHSDDLIAAILEGPDNAKYSGMKFLPKIDDKDYNYVRMMYATIGFPEFAEFVGD